jgi:anti-sigma factor RsiW
MQEHNKWNDLIPFYVARTLSPAEMRAFDARLARDETLRREVEEWRTIAGAVWREADAVARTKPPLAPDVLARAQQLRPAGAMPSAVYDNAGVTTGFTQRIRAVREARATSVPVTLVAGLVIAFVCGGLLVMLAFNNAREQTQPLVAQVGTGTVTDGGFAAADATGTSAAIAALITREPGILPTPTNTIMPIGTPVAAPSQTPNAFLPGLTPTMTAVPSQEFNTLLVTECIVLNNLSAPVNIYKTAERSAPVVEQIQPGESRSSIIRSENNWFMMFTPERGIIGWVAFEDVSVTTACNALPVATPAVMPTPLPTIEVTPIAPSQIAIITAPFVDLRVYPGTAYDILTTAGRDTRFTVVGSTVNPLGEQWLVTTLLDGQAAWLPLDSVQLEILVPAGEPTTTPLPPPEPTLASGS